MATLDQQQPPPRRIGREPPPAPPTSRRPLIILGVLAVIAIAAGAWWLGRASVSTRPPAPEPAASQTASTPAPPVASNNEPGSSTKLASTPTTSDNAPGNSTKLASTNAQLDEKYCGAWTMFGMSENGKDVKTYPQGIPFALVGNGKVTPATSMVKEMTISGVYKFEDTPNEVKIKFVGKPALTWTLAPAVKSRHPNDILLIESTFQKGVSVETFRALISVE